MTLRNRVFIFDNLACHTAQRGVARCFRHIAEGIAAHFGPRATYYSRAEWPLDASRRIRALPRRFRGSHRLGLDALLAGVDDRVASLAAMRDRAGVIYSPFYGNLRSTIPQVFMVHDMIHELFPAHFPQTVPNFRRLIEEKRRCFERARMLIAVSENTARDILRVNPEVDAHKIRVVHHGVDDSFFDALKPAREERPYFLFLGDRARYKNFQSLLLAFADSSLAMDYDLRVISTPARWSRSEQQVLAERDLRGAVTLTGAVSNGFLPSLYAGATAFIYPSEYEGFGLPLLEAMASGTIVIASNTSCLPEVGGDIPFYVAPHDIESIASALRRATAQTPRERADRVARGVSRARTFSWKRSQDLHISALEEALHG